MDFSSIDCGATSIKTPKKRPLVSGASVVIMPSQVDTISQITVVTPQKQLDIKEKMITKRIQESKQLLAKLEEATTVQDRDELKASLNKIRMLKQEEFAAIDQLRVDNICSTPIKNFSSRQQSSSKGQPQVSRRQTFASLQQTTLILELSDEDEEEE